MFTSISCSRLEVIMDGKLIKVDSLAMVKPLEKEIPSLPWCNREPSLF